MLRFRTGIRLVCWAFLVLTLIYAKPSRAQVTSYLLTIENLTNSAPNSGQSFSAGVFFTHDGSLTLWTLGNAASDPLRQVAEEGNNQPLLTDLSLAGNALGTVQVLPGVVAPGTSQSFLLTTDITSHPFLSSVWELTRTNDGFSGLSGINLAGITSPTSFDLIGLDAGTEVNNELRAYLPAFGGVFNDPENGVVAPHTGIRGDADAPASWNFSGPVARVSIAAAPEASSFALIAFGLFASAVVLRRKRA